MHRKLHIRKNDLVAVISGIEAQGHKTGKVIQVWPEKGKALVEGLNLVTKCMRKSQDNPRGSLTKIEAPLAVSNLLLYCPRCKQGVRASHTRDDKDVVQRKCKKCGHKFES